MKFLVVLGFLGLFAAGYGATSVVTSCGAKAQVCCSNSLPPLGFQCIGIESSMSAYLGVNFGAVVPLGLLYAAASVTVYYSAAIAEFGAKVVQQTGLIVNHWNNWWDTFWFYSFNPALQNMSKQLVALDVDQARQIGAFSDMIKRNQLISKRIARDVKSHSSQSPSEEVCAAGTLSSGMTQANVLTQAYNAAAPMEKLVRSGNAYWEPAGGGGAAEMQARFQSYATRYCDPNENLGNSNCAAAGAFAGLDRDVSGQIFQNATIDLKDPDIKQTVDDLIANVAEPFVKDPIPAGNFESSKGQQAVLKNESYKTQRQLVYDALYHTVARRAPTAALSDFTVAVHQAAGVTAENISPSRRKKTPEYASMEGGALIGKAHAQPAGTPLSPSKNEVQDAIATERTQTGDFAARQVTEPENTMRAAAVAEGARTRKLTDMLDLLDRYSLLVAGQVGGAMQADRPVDSKVSTVPLH